MSQDELEVLVRRHRLDDLQRMLAINEYETNDPDLRSLSPEPVYDPKTGVRTNTRDVRTKEKYTIEKNNVIEELVKLDPSFIVPSDYQPIKKKKKVYISEYAIQAILGYNGTNQKSLEQKSGCRIVIRGKGATRGKIYNKTENDENERLHVLITGDTDEKIKAAEELLEPLINPFDDPERRKHHLLDVALRNVLKDEYCENCGKKGHKMYNCPEPIGGANWQRADVMCEICKERSHPTKDCPLNRSSLNSMDEMKLHQEFRQFMNEVKGPDWDFENTGRALPSSGHPLMIEYNGGSYFPESSAHALAANVSKNTFSTPAAPPATHPLALTNSGTSFGIQTKYQGTEDSINIENVILTDANGNPIGMERPVGAVENPIMNPLAASMYTPYIASYNQMILNPQTYYSARPQANQSSSAIGFPKMPESYSSQ